MVKIHITENGPKVCKAQEGNCPLNEYGDFPKEHFSSMDEAQKVFEKIMENRMNFTDVNLLRNVTLSETTSGSSVEWKGTVEQDSSSYGTVVDRATKRRLCKAVKNELTLTNNLLHLGMTDAKLVDLSKRLKSPASMSRKLASEAVSEGYYLDSLDAEQANSIAESLNDIVRYTFLCEKHDDITRIIQESSEKLLCKGYETVQIKNSYIDGNRYKGFSIVWEHPTNKENFEIQYHSEMSLRLKKDSHRLYRVLRNFENSFEERSAAVQQCQEIYDALPTPEGLNNLKKIGSSVVSLKQYAVR